MEAEKGYSRDLVIFAGSDAQSLGMLKDALLSQIRLYEAAGIYFFGPITTHGQPEISPPYLTFWMVFKCVNQYNLRGSFGVGRGGINL